MKGRKREQCTVEEIENTILRQHQCQESEYVTLFQVLLFLTILKFCEWTFQFTCKIQITCKNTKSMFLKVTLNSSVKESPFIICYIISNAYIETEIYIACRKEKRKGKTMAWFCYVMNLPKLNLSLLREKENGEKIKLEKESTCRIREQAWFERCCTCPASPARLSHQWWEDGMKVVAMGGE